MNRKSKVLTSAVCGIALGLGTWAGAYWTGGGAGSGSAAMAANPQPLVISQTAVTGLAPGGSKTLAGIITNPNAFGVKVGSVTPGAITVDSGHALTLLSDYTVTGTAAVNALVPANGSAPWSGLTLSMADTTANQDASKGATLTIPFTLTPFVEPPAGPQLGTVTYTNAVLVVKDVGLWPTSPTGNMPVLPGDQLIARIPASGWDSAQDVVITTADAHGVFNFSPAGGYYLVHPGSVGLLRGGVFYPHSPVMMIG